MNHQFERPFSQDSYSKSFLHQSDQLLILVYYDCRGFYLMVWDCNSWMRSLNRLRQKRFVTMEKKKKNGTFPTTVSITPKHQKSSDLFFTAQKSTGQLAEAATFYQGQIWKSNLSGRLIRFRQHPVALMYDVERMFPSYMKLTEEYLLFFFVVEGWKPGAESWMCQLQPLTQC